MFLLRAVLNILLRNASPRGPMCFRCLIFNLSGPCELFVCRFILPGCGVLDQIVSANVVYHVKSLVHYISIFTLFYSLLDLRSSECNVVSLYVVCCSVNVSVCFVCCVLDSVCELFGETIRNVCGCSCYFVVECYGCV